MVANAAHSLRAAGIDSAARDARALVAHALGVAANRIVLLGSDPIDLKAQELHKLLKFSLNNLQKLINLDLVVDLLIMNQQHF